MQIARFSDSQNSISRLGLVLENGLADLSFQAPELPGSLNELLGAGSSAWERLQAVAKVARADYPLDEAITIEAPVEPRKCLAIGLNYRDHATEMGAGMPAHPIVFSKQVTAIQRPYGELHLPRVSRELDYEGELVCVIGRRCRHVPAARATEVIGGYCVGNDVSVRDWQLRTGQFTMGKSFDTHAPIGPWFVSADAIDDPHKLRITTRVNDEIRQQSSTDQLIFNCFELVCHLSQAFTLEPGDLIFTGTPAGVGAGMTPPRFLRAGDCVEVEIEGLGRISNTVIPEPKSTAFID